MIESLLHKEETDRQYFRAKVDLARSLFKKSDFNDTLLKVNKMQQSSHLGRHARLCREGLKCQHKFAEKSSLQEARDRRLFFYQTSLQSSPQSRYMFDIRELFLIDALKFIPGQIRDLLRTAIDLPD